ncbi:hypothetical protein ACFSOY_08895 [Tumebacillus lipolyticus]|uniref:Secreted protein n=1 Tax=Tumebacillus lipolyticus TaxID=1280370 RepID=A0ABW4ZXV0_9BACL
MSQFEAKRSFLMRFSSWLLLAIGADRWQVSPVILPLSHLLCAKGQAGDYIALCALFKNKSLERINRSCYNKSCNG